METVALEAPKATTSRASADWELWKKRPALRDLLRSTLIKREITVGKLTRDLVKLSRAPGSISATEYFRYRLYRPELSEADKACFMSDRIQWPLCNLSSDPQWRAATEDKWLSYSILQSAGHRIPENLAVFDSRPRNYGLWKHLRSANELTAFLESNENYPLFAKPNRQIASFGAVRVECYTNGLVTLNDGTQMTAAKLVELVFGDDPYLFQCSLQNHPSLGHLSKYLATLRLINFVTDTGVLTPFAVLKIPAGGNVADNFWRVGNRLGQVDKSSGTVVRIVEGTGPDQQEFLDQKGLKLPFWNEALELNRSVAGLFAPVAFNSLDIALTDSGPVVVEINSGSSFDLYQVSSGKGFLTPEVHQFFRSHGWKK